MDEKTEPFPKMRPFPGEQEAIRDVLDAGAIYGFGNMISHLQEAWIDHLMHTYNMSRKSARLAVIMEPEEEARDGRDDH